VFNILNVGQRYLFQQPMGLAGWLDANLLGHVKLLSCAMGPNRPLSALRKASIGRFNTTLQLASILAIDTVEV